MDLNAEDGNFDNFSDSDIEGGEEEHKRLMKAISQLDKRKIVLPSQRKEASIEASEFNLTKESSSNVVNVGDLAKSLRLKGSHLEVYRGLKAAQRKSKTLPAPLPSFAAEKIKRQVGYENVKQQVTKWDPIVHRHRTSDDQAFPLKPSQRMLTEPKDFFSADSTASELEKQMAEVLGVSPSVQKEKEEEEEFALSLEEMIERRKEMARLRVHESYKHAKAHRQKKIKSKKFHRFARRERIRQKIKEFEELQKKDPEVALQKLEELDKERILERASLRHRSTGQWAKNKSVHAKYDKESRQVLAEQLKLSKDLTQKTRVESDSSDEGELDAQIDSTPSNNPWISEADVDEFLSGYRKYWLEKSQKASAEPAFIGNEGNEGRQESMNSVQSPVLEKSAVTSYSEIPASGQPASSNPSPSDSFAKQVQKKNPEKPLTPKHQAATEKNSQISPSECGNKTENSGRTSVQKSQSGSSKTSKVVSCGMKWTVTSLDETSSSIASLDDMFCRLNDNIIRKTEAKLSDLKQELACQKKQKENNMDKRAPNKRNRNTSNVSDPLEFKKKKVQFADAKLDEGDENNGDDYITLMKKNIKLANSESDVEKSVTELDPNKFMKTRSIHLNTALPDEITGGDDGLDDSDIDEGKNEKIMTISEAFADDDVVADFDQEKQEAIDKSKPEDVSLFLPGWGSWGGHNIKPTARKKSRFMVKMPAAPRRRDENKGNLIINEAENDSARAHRVNEMPFPFSRVKDFEASVRAPIGNTFIPESAHRKLIKPPVSTKLGTVITPIDKEVLVKHQQSMKQRKKKAK